MTKKFTMKPLATAFGAVLATSLMSIPAANADENPFGMTKLSGGYMVAESNLSGTDAEKPGSEAEGSKYPRPPSTPTREDMSGTDAKKPGSWAEGSKYPRPPSSAPSGDDMSGTDAEKPGR